jgi:CRP/FNR family cyclic AMP-dependent transcriptional regulator
MNPALPDAIAASFDCAPDVAQSVAAQARLADYAPRNIIVTGGQSSDQIYLMVDGHARMLAFSLDGRLMVVEDFAAGDLFGEGALIGEGPVADEITAVDAVSAGIFQAQVMIALMSAHPSIALAISRRLVARLSAVSRRLVEGTTLSATGRIHAEILRRARTGKDMTIRPAPVLSELALHVSSTRETVSRTVSALIKRGILRRDDEALIVVAPHRLEELVF